MVDSQDWSSALQRTIMLAQLPDSESNPRTSRYPSGELWKCILRLSIIADLKGTNDEDDTNATRFIRIEHVGLSGVIFYSAPSRRALMEAVKTIDLEVDALIERNAVQVLYFPSMACTSFVTGQVMKAHLLSDPSICPKPHHSGSGFYLNSRAFETLREALVRGSSVPIRDLSSRLKPTPQCADRVLKDRHHAKHAARLLLAVRYRNAIRNTPRASTPSSVPEITLGKLSLDPVPLRRVDVDSEGEEYHDALENLPPPSPPTLRSNAAIPTFDCANKLPLLPVLRDHRHANTLSIIPTSVDQKNLEKKYMKVLELAGEKENDVFA